MSSAPTARREGITADAAEQRTVANIPLGRMVEPAEFADAVVFLASDRANYITGQTIVIDGGMAKGTV